MGCRSGWQRLARDVTPQNRMTELPKYDSPPVIETVLGVQFSPLPKFTNAHAGWFWKKCLDETWIAVQEAPPIQDVFERFGEEKLWGPEAALRVFTEPTSNRSQIIRADNARMIQVQPTRFMYNWKKSDGVDYPSYEKLLPEFNGQFGQFGDFVSEAGYPGLDVNQWEVTYVNQIPKGDLWDEVTDWAKIIPRLSVFGVTVPGQVFDGFGGTWSQILAGNRGRLHITVRHARVGSAKGPEILSLQLTARGPVDSNNSLSLQEGFDLGHKAIVLSFDEMTSTEAHKHWGRKG